MSGHNFLDEFLRSLSAESDPKIKAFITVLKHGQKAPLSEVFTLARALGLELRIKVLPTEDEEAKSA